MNPAEKEVENRRLQLRKWITDHFPSAAAFAAKHGLNQGEISGLLNKKSFGSRKARNLEESAGMPFRYLEQPNESGRIESDAVESGPEIIGKLPLITWVRAGELCDATATIQHADAEDWLDCPVKHGPGSYCLRVVGDSMDDGTAEGYRDGEIIFIDPDLDAKPGRDVVVRTPDGKATFKRLKQDQDGLYLLGLNGKRIIRVPEGTVFCGVVIFSGVKR